MKKLVSLLLILVLATALTVPAFAAGAPSVEVPAAPVISTTTAPVAVDEDGNEVEIPAEDIKVEAAAKLTGDDKAAYDTLAAATDVSTVCANVEEVLKKIDSKVSAADLVVRDVFKITFDGNAKEVASASDKSYVQVAFEYDVKAGDTVIVMQLVDGEWVALDTDMYEVVDGEIILKLTTDGAIAIATTN